MQFLFGIHEIVKRVSVFCCKVSIIFSLAIVIEQWTIFFSVTLVFIFRYLVLNITWYLCVNIWYYIFDKYVPSVTVLICYFISFLYYVCCDVCKQLGKHELKLNSNVLSLSYSYGGKSKLEIWLVSYVPNDAKHSQSL